MNTYVDIELPKPAALFCADRQWCHEARDLALWWHSRIHEVRVNSKEVARVVKCVRLKPVQAPEPHNTDRSIDKVTKNAIGMVCIT
jgi:hypothetical protein